MSKAFDCVDHDVLLPKVTCYGVLEHCLVWFASYLSCHQQKACIQGAFSTCSWGKVHVRVPQASILDPLYCSAFI